MVKNIPPTPHKGKSERGCYNEGASTTKQIFPRAHGKRRRNSVNKSQIRKSLTEQLNEMGAKVAHFEDLINDYLALYDVKNQLIKEIKDRGVTYPDYSAAGVAMQKNNPSTKDLVSVNRQMLAILKELGVSTTSIKKPEDNDEL